MSGKKNRRAVSMAFAFAALFSGATGASAQSGPTDSLPAIYGLAVDPASAPGPSRPLLIASDYGVLRATPDGTSTIISNRGAAIIGFAANPGNPREIYLSGFSQEKKSFGVMKSGDGGANWQKASDGNIGLTGFVFSGTKGRIIAIGQTIQTSTDGGKTWQPLANSPEKIFSIAAAPADDNVIFAATMDGLLQSKDGGQSWIRSHESSQPATMVASLSEGRTVAFVYEVGLIETDMNHPGWRILKDGFQDRYLLDLIEDPANAQILYATTDTGAILMSRDAGTTWFSYEGSDKRTGTRLAAGKALFEANCQICHGVMGIGEDPANPEARDEFGFKAPALNDDAHAWHHSDASLSATIHNGSPRNERMIAWQDQLSDDEINSILVYIKSLWNLRSLSCQGGRHMTCMGG